MSDDKQEQPSAETKGDEILDGNVQDGSAADVQETPTAPLEVASVSESEPDGVASASESSATSESASSTDNAVADESPATASEGSSDVAAPNAESTAHAPAASDDADTASGSDAALPPTSEARLRSSSAARREAAFKAFPVDKDHASARELVVDSGGDNVDLTPAKGEQRGSQNLVAVILIVAVSALGLWQLSIVSSDEVLAAKRAEREAMEEQFLAEQMAKQKRYGILRIESTPPQASVVKDGESIVVTPGGDPVEATAENGATPAADGVAAAPGTAPAAAPGTPGTEGGDGQPRAGTTPMNLMNVDIGQTYKFKVSKEGYEPFEFAVAEHLWTKDAGEYKFIKMIELIPINCEYWFLYDAKKRREVQFEQKLGCMDHYKQSVASQISVTECACKLPPPPANPDGTAPQAK